MSVLNKIFGSRNDRLLRGYSKYVKRINEMDPEYKALTDNQLQQKTADFKKRLEDGAELLSLLPEAFATVREAAWRTIGLRPFDAQCIGGMVLNEGKIAEMRTGEGKTLASTLPAYLNALTGQGVHVITVNDYLAQRDAEWMRPVYDFLGMTVGINLSGMEIAEKKQAYAADIVYGTNNEFGFDYLRDNMVYELDHCVQRGLAFAIIDEVDSILIDEARTPLIISGHAEESSDLYQKLDRLIPKLTEQVMTEEEKEEDLPDDRLADYIKDEKNRQVFLTDLGHKKIEELLTEMGLLEKGSSLYDIKNITMMHYVNAALRAHTLHQKDVDYVVKDDQIIIVDEHTGRLMEGRRWSEGLHQAVEAKEGVAIQIENQTMATITFQNYFRLYGKLSGMTGTADTEAFELQKIYGLEVVVVPTNKPMVRQDRSDKVFLNQKGKYKAILEEIKAAGEKQQPVLVGTASIESSELLSRFLKQENIQHEVLNAKQHEREAKVIANAGMPSAVTIATNMAGRGTDIVLGGNLEAELEGLEGASDDQVDTLRKAWKARHQQVIEAGGLHVLATERHESRRIDNQLRGRSGRQGDPGSSQFYLCMEDNLLRIFGGDKMSNMMVKLGVGEDDVIQHPMIHKRIEGAQRRVEGYNYDIRKSLLEFDDVANDQRKVIYQQRHDLLQADNIQRTVEEIRGEVIEALVATYMPPDSIEDQWDIAGLETQLQQDFNLKLDIKAWLEADGQLTDADAITRIIDAANKEYSDKEVQLGQEQLREIEKNIMLQILDHQWKEHLAAMEHLRQGIHLRGYAQKNPTQEFKRESFEMFEELMRSVQFELSSTLLRAQINDAPETAPMPQQNVTYHHADFDGGLPQGQGQADPTTEEPHEPFRRTEAKVGRNALCPCGSGKKYKQCHGKLS